MPTRPDLFFSRNQETTETMVSIQTPATIPKEAIGIPIEASGEFLKQLEDEMIMDFGSVSAENNALQSFGCTLALLFII